MWQTVCLPEYLTIIFWLSSNYFSNNCFVNIGWFLLKANTSMADSAAFSEPALKMLYCEKKKKIEDKKMLKNNFPSKNLELN